MSKHTAGPWTVAVETHDRCGWDQPRQYVTISAGETIIAHYDTSAIEYPETDEENAANAQVLGAASDMLAALQQVEREMRAGLGSSYGETREQIRRAITKATTP